jgi:putative PIN family toxin of toxin-antitoxin system
VIGVTLDSNIYISGLEFSGIGLRLLNMGRAGIIRIDVSAAIIDEVIRVLRDDFRWEGYRLHFAREKLAKIGNVVVPRQSLQVIDEDPDDDRILECAVEARSEYIVTFDKDLLRQREYAAIPIITPADFLQRGIELA